MTRTRTAASTTTVSKQLIAVSTAAESIVRGATAMADIVAPVADIVRVCADCATQIAQQQTERTRIEAHTRVQIELIRSRRELMVTFLDRVFAERQQNFGGLFDQLDSAMERHDAQATKAILDTITDLAKSSPFEALRNAASAHQALLDKNTTWEF